MNRVTFSTLFILLVICATHYAAADNTELDTFCNNAYSKCNSEALKESGLENENSLDLNNIDKGKACQFFKSFKECAQQLNGKCDNHGNTFKQSKELADKAAALFKCASSGKDPEISPDEPCSILVTRCNMEAYNFAGIQDVLTAGKDKACKYVKRNRECLGKLTVKCTNDLVYLGALKHINDVEGSFKCGSSEPEGDPLQTCEILNAECAQKASRESGLENGITPENLAKVGKEVFCKFGKSYRECYKTLNGKCDHVDFIKSAKDLIDQSYNALKCGCGSIVASFALITASLWFLFQRKV